MSNHTGRRLPINTVHLDFTEDGYPGFTAEARTNIPVRVGDAYLSGTEEQRREACLLTFPSWDFVDEEGEPIPHTLEGIGLMTQDLLTAMFTRWTAMMEGATAIPKANGADSAPTSLDVPEENPEESPSGTPA
jgi:hypothetical protein